MLVRENRSGKIWMFLLSFALLCALVGSLYVHAWNLGVSPMGLFSDEASIGLNAKTIAEYETDEFGTPTPLYFQAFGEYKNPVYIYALAWLLQFVPMSDISVRGVSFLFFVGILLIWTIFAELYWKNRGLTVLHVLMLGASPWLFTLSRVSFEAISFVFLYISFLTVFFVIYINKFKGFLSVLLLSVLCGILAGFSWYSYSTARLLMLISIFGSCALLLFQRKRLAPLLIFCVGVLALLPATGLLEGNSTILLGRFSQISYFYDVTLTWGEKIGQFLQIYSSYFSPEFHLWVGDSNLRHHAGPAGMSSYFVYGSMWIGVFLTLFAWRKRKLQPFSDRAWFANFMLMEFFAAPLAASMTEPGHAIRVVSMIIPMLFFSGVTLAFLRRHLQTWAPIVGISAVLLILLEATPFLSYALGHYTRYSVRYFMTYGTEEAVRTVAAMQYPLLVIDKDLYEANVIASYYTETLNNAITITSGISDTYIQNIQIPFCYLAKHTPYTQTTKHVAPNAIPVPLDVQSRLKLTCFPGETSAQSS